MNELELIQNISKYLSRFKEQIKILNAIGDFSINKYAENLLLKLLNATYQLNLINVNTELGPNYSAIDLLDKKNSIAIQVTATNSFEKIKKTIEKFYRNNIYIEAKELFVYILTDKKSHYPQSKIDNLINSEVTLSKNKKYKISFNVDKHILDQSDLIKKLNKDNEVSKLLEVENILRSQFEIIEQHSNLSDYYKSLKNLYYDIVMNDENGLTLNQIYIEPSFSILKSAFFKDDVRLHKKRPEKLIKVDERYKLEEFINDQLSELNTLKLREHFRLIVLLGFPGQGKSSFCKYFLNKFITSSKSDNKSIFYIQLRNIRNAHDFILNPLGVLFDESCLLTEQNLKKTEFYKSLLVLDGLDELYMKENLKLDEIEKLCIELTRLLDKHPQLQIILTSRYGYINDERLSKENVLFLHLELFTLEQQYSWLEKYKRYHTETWMDFDKLTLFNTDISYRHVKELINQPILLHMIASMQHEVDATTNRSKVYQQLFTELIDRKYSKSGTLEIFKNIEKEELRNLIREIAFAIFQKGNEYITKNDLLKLSSTQKFLKLFPEENLRDSIKGVMISFYFKETLKKDSYLDEDKSDYAIEFLHKSLQEYMTAEKIVRTLSDNFLDQRKNDRYVIDDAISGLKVIDHLFGSQPLSYEVYQHLEYIFKEYKVNKDEFANRLSVFIDEYLEADFLLNYNALNEKFPLDKILNTFYGYWSIFSVLDNKKNIFKNKMLKDRFIYYLCLLSYSNEHDLYFFDFSNQDLSESSMKGVHFDYNTFKNTDFERSSFRKVIFEDCNITETNFTNCTFQNCIFETSKIKKANFQYSELHKISLQSSIFNNCIFTNCEIIDLEIKNFRSFEKTAFENCNFENCSIDNKSLKKLKKSGVNIEMFKFIILDKIEEIVDDSTSLTLQDDDTQISNDYKRIA